MIEFYWYPGYKTKSCPVIKTVKSHASLSKSPSKCALNFNMLYNANVILNKFLYRMCLLFGVYKYLIYRFYTAAQFVTWYFAKLQKQEVLLLSVLKPKPVSDTKRNILFKLMKTFMESWRVSDSIGNVKIRFIYCKLLEVDQTHFPEQRCFIFCH